MAQFKTFDARVLRSLPLSEFTKHIELEVNGVTGFDFVPGQWLSVDADSLDAGAEIAFQGPFGNFILHPPVRDTVFIATGTGIAPFRSMLHWLLAKSERHQGRQFWLLFGARREQDIYYREEFERLAADHAKFHFLPTLSRADPEWKGLRGYVQEHLAEIVGARTDMHAYICGLDKMVKANRELLKSLGWDRTSIRYEKYD